MKKSPSVTTICLSEKQGKAHGCPEFLVLENSSENWTQSKGVVTEPRPLHEPLHDNTAGRIVFS
jgi:hypothetical protein